ncbi:hypothetical protein [Actinomycetospora soli]|uniref:hypothetical protein n=1 Tax=Actinomycetospora soli TaxID=2893887 RepID=UPI001E3D87D8|nr:hypothetical protein [Actinomycetospora soli]MCD2190214.1 hypothetical protein [Actinomycetospora soli]
MRRNPRTDDLTYLRTFADADVIAVVELVRLGVPETTIYRRCRPGGPWRLLAPGVVLLATGVPTRPQRLRAALLHGGAGAQVTGLDAARLHGLRRGTVPDDVHVLIPGGRQVRSVRHVLVERTTRLLPPVVLDGLPLAPVERCVLDAARRLPDRSEVAALLTEPVQRRMVSREALETELDAGCRRGSAVPRAILRTIAAGVRSPAEFAVREWWLAHPELGEALFNVAILDGRGRFVGVADVFDEEIGLVGQVDSTEHHFMTPDQVIETERQHRAYRSAGLHVIGIRPNRLRLDPDGLHRDVLDARRVAAALPRAEVTWRPDLPSAG